LRRGLTAALLAALAVQSWRLAAVRRLAETDALTGLPNRRGLARAWRGGRWRLFLVDLVGFKAVNDAQGHAAGDAVLKAVARRMAAVLPADLFLARYGGDEFVLLAPDASDPPCFLARALAGPFAVPGGEPVRIGFTIAEAPPGPDLDAALAAASAVLREVRAGNSG
jgi:GGDEF domain-containing protein